MLEGLLTVAKPYRKLVGHPQLKMRQLALVVHLDEQGTLTGAAAATGLTQSGACKLLQQVESTLEVKLFERRARKMAPTCYGEILLRHARMALSGLGRAREEISALKSGLTGKATVGTVLNPGTHIVPLAVARVKQQYPSLLLGIEIHPNTQLVQRLLQGHLDIVVGRVLETRRAGELVYEPLATDEPHAIIASAEHPLARRGGVDLEDLVDQRWILPPDGDLVRDRLFSMFLRRHLAPPTNIVETQSLPVMTSLLQQGDYVAALPEQAVQSCCKAGTVEVLVRNLPLAIGGFGLVTRRHDELSPVAQRLFNTLREVGRELNSRENRAAAHRRMKHV
jgi:DNA-binding transcriptional LysR family regulator